MSIDSSNSNRLVTAYIPARYERATNNGYEHSRRSMGPAAITITFAMFLSGGAALAAAVQQGWIPTLVPPRHGVQSLRLTATIASPPSETQEVAVIRPTLDQEPTQPAGSGRPEMAPREASAVGRIAMKGFPIQAPPREKPSMSGLAAPQVARAERSAEPEVTSPDKRRRKLERNEQTSPPSVASPPSKEQSGVRKSAPRPIQNPEPRFPPELLARQIGGVVVVSATVAGNGKVLRVRLFKSSGYDAFDQSALEAVLNWRFNDDPHVATESTVDVRVPLRFRVEQ